LSANDTTATRKTLQSSQNQEKFSFRRVLNSIGNNGYVYLLPAMVVLLLLTLYPFLYVLNLSFQEWNLFKGLGARHYVGIRNYITIFTDPSFLHSFMITLGFSLISVAVSFLAGLGLASALSSSRGAVVGIMRTIVLIPMTVTPVVIATAWKYMYDPDSGIINYFLAQIGIHGINWISAPKLALISLCIVDIWQWTPFMFLVLLAGFEARPRAPYEAAMCDGLSRYQVLRFITFPLLKPMILIAILFRTIDSLRTFDIIFIMTGGGPGDLTTTLNLSAYLRAFRMLKFGEGAAVVIVIFAMVYIASNYLVKFLGKSEEAEK
jgi:multiple sugar transport system permease protein